MIQYCFECGEINNLHKHHVVPESLGGTKTIFLCEVCHGKVHDKNMTIVNLTKEAMQKLKKEGKRIGTIPYGKMLNNGFLIDNPDEMSTMRLILHLNKSGMSVRKIITELTNQKIKPRGNSWHKTTIQRLIKIYK